MILPYPSPKTLEQVAADMRQLDQILALLYDPDKERHYRFFWQETGNTKTLKIQTKLKSESLWENLPYWPFGSVNGVSADYTMTGAEQVLLADTTLANVTITLPAASACDGSHFTIKKVVSANLLTVAAQGGSTIDGAASQTLVSAYDSIDIVSDGSNWYII
jgi:hypothetical protein